MPYQFNTTTSRSRNMQAIKSTNNRTTECRIRAHLSNHGIRGWRVRPSNWPGRPDFVFPAARIAVFVDGCFWHGCPKCGHIPKTNVPYWKKKLARNKARDRVVTQDLKSQGFKVIRLWECQVKSNPIRCLESIIRHLKR